MSMKKKTRRFIDCAVCNIMGVLLAVFLLLKYHDDMYLSVFVIICGLSAIEFISLAIKAKSE